jgi:hypothetical protein
MRHGGLSTDDPWVGAEAAFRTGKKLLITKAMAASNAFVIKAPTIVSADRSVDKGARALNSLLLLSARAGEPRAALAEVFHATSAKEADGEKGDE